MAVFSDVVILPMLRKFDFRDVPKSLRTRLIAQERTKETSLPYKRNVLVIRLDLGWKYIIL
jgi:hypothetical protein